MLKSLSLSIGTLPKGGPIFIPILCFDDIFQWLDKYTRILRIKMETIFNYKICCLNVFCRKFSGWFLKPASVQTDTQSVNQSKKLLNSTCCLREMQCIFLYSNNWVKKQPPQVFCKKMLLKISQISQESTCVGVVQGLKLYWKATLTHVFSCEICELFKNTFFGEHMRTAVSIGHLFRKINANFKCKAYDTHHVQKPW